jgi:YkoY family integral membrane protein
MFGQTFQFADLAVIGLLVVLEGILSIDNALVLGILAKRLPKHQQRRALTYGLVGAFVFRFLAIATATFLLKWTFVKLLGGMYLVYIAVKHFLTKPHNEAALSPDGGSTAAKPVAKFWPTVFVIELTDIAFAVDSILAAVGVVGSPPPGTPPDAHHPKLWVVITGGFLGVILMRYAAVLFIRLLDRFPRFETAAYLLVTVIGLKLLADWGFNSAEHPHRLNFHSLSSPAFWVFWMAMVACFTYGFLQPKNSAPRVSREAMEEAIHH